MNDWMSFINDVRREAGHSDLESSNVVVEIDLFDEDCRLLA